MRLAMQSRVCSWTCTKVGIAKLMTGRGDEYWVYVASATPVPTTDSALVKSCQKSSSATKIKRPLTRQIVPRRQEDFKANAKVVVKV